MNPHDRNRRRALKALGSAGALGVLSACALPTPAPTPPARLGKVMVIGAGFGGATAARYLKLWGGPGLEVMLIDRNPQFVSCPLSNLVIGGSRKIEELTVSYQGLREQGVVVISDEVSAIDAARKRVVLGKIADQTYDRLVVAPGIDFNFGAVQGLDAEAQKTVLHAWKAGPQTVELRRQLEAMPDGGVFVMSIPLAPYRCPPGPYERACQVAHYFKTRKPRSKVVILDANPEIISKKGLFTKAFTETYAGIVEYRPNSNVTEIDARGRAAITEVGDRVRGDVLNVIPPQAAGDIARKAGLINANNRWCQVDWVSMESTAAPGVHVLGDATLSAPAMPKSGHMANQHGKAAAAAIVESLSGRAPQPQMMANTCYSFIDDRQVVHVASVHRYSPEKKTMEAVAGAGGLSVAPNLLEGAYANAWAQTIWKDMFAG
jgi:sulfide dehydrogenase [flavocytochrome c] flavoprotein subunit